jgi:CheY-like chemotaxis protein/HPt (histidine-containing phosphotransfer) domain-containing protein
MKPAHTPAITPATSAITPTILLVEDDPTTCAYLLALTEALPARVDAAASVAAALRYATASPYDLWLVDANLPDGIGIELLAQLRALSPATPALAHTAAHEPGEFEPLVAAGFAEVLVKPIDADAWRTAIRRALGRVLTETACRDAADPSGELPLWDDDAAARALGGNVANVAALRGLFLSELPAQIAAIRDGDAAARRNQLHRLRASCAFVGACRLEEAVRSLQDSADDATLQAFLRTAELTLSQASGESP